MLAYLDANILIAYTLGPRIERRNYPFAQRVFTNISNGVYTGLISNLVLVEILNVFRRMKGGEFRHLRSLPSDKDRLHYIKSESDSMFQILVASLMQAGTQIQFTNCNNIDASKIFDTCIGLLNNALGKVDFHYNECQVCGSRFDYSRYKGLGPVDLSHVFLAKELGCDQLITLDQCFEEIQHNPDISPLNIVVLK